MINFKKLVFVAIFSLISFVFSTPVYGQIPSGIKTFENLAYVTDGHALQKLDLYIPKNNREAPLPLIIWIHGGGWQKGSKNQISRLAFILDNGFALASVDYRLTSDATFPAQIHDCKAAVRYLRRNARSFGIDPTKFGVWGASAGGHLVALLGTTNGNKELEGNLGITNASSDVQAVVDFYGPTDLGKMVESARKRIADESELKNNAVYKLLGGIQSEHLGIARMASPINFVSEDDVTFLIMHGDEDPLVPLSESENFYKRLQEVNVESELIVVPGAKHGFFKDPGLHQKVVDFFSEQLKTISETSIHEDNSDWIQLFNGKDLTGWTAKIRGHELGDNYAETFRVKDGKLIVSYDDYKSKDLINMDGKKKTTFDKFGHLFYNEPFSHYILRVEYRFVGEQIKNGPEWAWRNNGIMIHGQDPATMTKMQKFPVSFEVQLLGGNGKDERPNLNLCTPGTNVVIHGKLIEKHITRSNSKTYHGDQWISAEIEVHGSDVIRHKTEGKTLVEYFQTQYDKRSPDAQPLISEGNLMIDGGTISLQSESHPIEFRKIELKKLNPDNKNYRFVGNWAIKMPDGSAGWLSLKEENETLSGELWMVGAPKTLTKIFVKADKLHFTHQRSVGEPEYIGGPPTGKKISINHIAHIEGDKLFIEMDHPLNVGGAAKQPFRGKRLSVVPPKPDLNSVKYGGPIQLFNGKNLDGWRLTNSGQTNKWKVVDGVLFNDTPKKSFDPFAHYGNLRTDMEFNNFNLQLDFNVPKGGNSGIYLKGRYEVQVVDHDSRMQGIHGVGAVFNRILPKGNFGKAGGEWQHYDITLLNRHVTIKLNGETVIDNEPIEGCTNGAIDADESLPGPIYFQGDHTSVSYKNIVLRELIED